MDRNQTAARPPPDVPDHTLLHLIGRGAYGEVWLARNALGTLRAVKVIHRADFSDPRPFEREFRGIQKFEPISRTHDGLIDILQVGRNDAEGWFYYVMELGDPAPPEDAAGPAPGMTGVPETPVDRLLPRSDSPRPPASDPHLPSPLSDLPSPGSPLPALYVPRTLRRDLVSRGRLPLGECLAIGRVLASALEHLHRAGLVHRDVKPSNIVFVRGQPKLADIGLVADANDGHSIVGTEGYLPPEGAGSPEADLYSLGKVLYEMSTGIDRRLFPELPTQLTDAAEATRLRELNEIVLKACAPDPARRHRQATALREELERLERGCSIVRRRAWQRAGRTTRQLAPWAALGLLAVGACRITTNMPPAPIPVTAPVVSAAPVEKASVFVLRFQPWYRTVLDDLVPERMADAFIEALAQVEGVRRSLHRFGWGAFDEAEVRSRIFRTNDVQHVLCGRVDTQGEDITLQLRLFGRGGDEPVWTNTFTGLASERVRLERQAVDALLSVLGLTATLQEQEAIDRVLENNLAAEQVLGPAWVAFKADQTGPDARLAMQTAAEKAVGLDPGYLFAKYLGAVTLRNEASIDRAGIEVWPRVKRDMEAILEKDDTLDYVYDQYGGAVLLFDRDWAMLDQIAQRGHACSTGHVLHVIRSLWLRMHGMKEEARKERDLIDVMHVDPKGNSGGWYNVVGSYWFERNWPEAIAMARRLEAAFPGTTDSLYCLAYCLVDSGQLDEGLEVIEQLLAIRQRQSFLALKGYTYGRMGRTKEARTVLGELLRMETVHPYLQPYFVARVYASIGEQEKAIDWLEMAVEERADAIFYPDFAGLRTDPAWDDYLGHPRFQALLKKVGLDQWPVPITPWP